MPEVGILILDDDITSQTALKHVLDSEGSRVTIVDHSSHAMAELASGTWDLAIVNVAQLDMHGPVFATLKELVQSDAALPGQAGPGGKRFRALFLVPLMGSKEVPLILEQEGLPYAFKPYHLHDFLQKVSELLIESGAISQPIRSVEGFGRKKRRGVRLGDPRSSHDPRSGQKMFASREDYQMTEEEIAEFERQEKEEEERKKRDKQILNREQI